MLVACSTFTTSPTSYSYDDDVYDDDVSTTTTRIELDGLRSIRARPGPARPGPARLRALASNTLSHLERACIAALEQEAKHRTGKSARTKASGSGSVSRINTGHCHSRSRRRTASRSTKSAGGLRAIADGVAPLAIALFTRQRKWGAKRPMRLTIILVVNVAPAPMPEGCGVRVARVAATWAASLTLALAGDGDGERGGDCAEAENPAGEHVSFSSARGALRVCLKRCQRAREVLILIDVLLGERVSLSASASTSSVAALS